jgi:hypothetical protein
LPPFFFPPLAAFLAIALNPPLHSWDSDREELSPHRSAAASWHVGLPPSALIASLRHFRARRGRLAAKKLGVSSIDTPSPQAERLALLAALFLSALSSLLRHDSSLELAAQLI